MIDDDSENIENNPPQDQENSNQLIDSDNIESNDSVTNSSSQTSLRSSERLRIKNSQKNKLFNLILSKNENSDYDNSQQTPQVSDDTPFEWQSNSTPNSREYSSSNNSNNGSLMVSLVADFPKNFAENNYNKRPFEVIDKKNKVY
jgi:hypothetical protein